MVIKINKEDGYRGRPEGLNTTNLLKVASDKMGIGPHQAMIVAERLYLSGFITYPRTESTFYPKKFEFGKVVNALKYHSNNKISEYANKLQKLGLSKPKHGVDCGDHPPITPTEKTFKPTSKSTNEDIRLYEYISQHFLATISEDFKFAKVQQVLEFGNYKFNLNGTQGISDGFIEVMPWLKVPDQFYPNLKINDKIQVHRVEVNEQYTTQPDYMSESELIGKMEQYGIGTDASMAMHINNICEREYVVVAAAKRQLVPTDLGFNLIASYEVIDKALVEPQLRSSIEGKVNLIAKQKTDYLQVTKEVLSVFLQKFDYFIANISKLDQLFLKSFETVEGQIEKAQTLSKCGKCQRYMKFLPKKLQLVCEKCNAEYLLPQDGKVKIHGEKYCEICKFQIVVFSQSGTQRSYYVCPYCYNKTPEIEEVKNQKKLSCMNCPLKTCNFSYVNNSITKCDSCQNGQLILDPIPSSGRHYMTCNVCNVHKVLIEKAKDVKRQASKCEKCGAQQLKIVYQKVQQKQGQKDQIVQPNDFSGCLFCDQQQALKYKQINEDYKKEIQESFYNQKHKHYGKHKHFKAK
eukprot:TRINITY_DN4070_c0_g1_i5.p1 TRINITY_DN4070_c0_g1~~TRINITY_DN4070_c0_g1_i5.p1  ORF type:complete len:576 (-),score=79.71 TRINITY_DN4070_c0_g1_i5:23-1750(-)